MALLAGDGKGDVSCSLLKEQGVRVKLILRTIWGDDGLKTEGSTFR